MTITDIGHTALACHDLEASIAFYEQLGIRESFRLLREDGGVRLVYLHIGGDRFLELFPGGPEPGTTPVGSFRHICLLTGDMGIERMALVVVCPERESPSLHAPVGLGYLLWLCFCIPVEGAYGEEKKRFRGEGLGCSRPTCSSRPEVPYLKVQ